MGGRWSGEEVVPEDCEDNRRSLTLMLTVSHALPPTPVVSSVLYSWDSVLEGGHLLNLGTPVLNFSLSQFYNLIDTPVAGLRVGAHVEQVPVSVSSVPRVVASPSFLRFRAHAAPPLAPVRV